MKITRKYSPHHIIFETVEEYDAFWEMVQHILSYHDLSEQHRNMLLDISNGFSDDKQDM